MKENMNIVIVGHVDHGKSTIIGRLLADTNSLPEGKLQQVKDSCERNSKPFEYAFLLDALKDEQAQGITIDTARVFFETELRKYIIMDAPGHIEFLKNMITGASRAEAALLVIDAKEGVQENSRRHGYMLSLLGINQIAVVVNKMDLVDYNEECFNQIKKEYSIFLKSINIVPSTFIPVSGFKGDNIVESSKNLEWFSGHSILSVLDNFLPAESLENQNLRIPVQDVYKFTKLGDDRRIIVGNVEAGTLNVDDEIVFYPSGKSTKVASIEGFNTEQKYKAVAGQPVGFTTLEQIYVKRGEIVAKKSRNPPKASTRLKTSIFWLGKNPMKVGKNYYLKLGTTKVTVKIEEITKIIDSSNLSSSGTRSEIKRNEVAECILKLKQVIAFDVAEDVAITSRFVIVDDYEIRGGGIITGALSDKQTDYREKVFRRNKNWIKSGILPIERAKKYNQKSNLIIITGEQGSRRKEIARNLEKELFYSGKQVYYLGIGNVKYGVDADINEPQNREEHIRRLAEVSHLLIDFGMILIVTARNLYQTDLEIIKTSVNPELITTCWIGQDVTTDIAYDMQLSYENDMNNLVSSIIDSLEEKGYIFKVW